MGEGLAEYLRTDPVYMQVQNDFSILHDNLSTKDDREMLEMLKKTSHLLKLLGFMLFHNGGSDHLPSKFFNYGCWCSQHTKNPNHQGHGTSVDLLDRICKKNQQCRKCSIMDFGDTCHSYKGYTFRAELDSSGSPTLTCLDEYTNAEMSGCRQSLCQCDMDLISRLADGRDTYNINFSTGLSGIYDRDQQCEYDLCQNQPGGCKQADMCCGEYPDRGPQYSDEGKNGCCGMKHFIKESQQCCAGRVIDSETPCR